MKNVKQKRLQLEKDNRYLLIYMPIIKSNSAILSIKI
jgi:hypothetical protein